MNDREGINNSRPETPMETVIGEGNDHRDNEPETHSHEKALLRRKDLEIESLQDQIRDLHYAPYLDSNNRNLDNNSRRSGVSSNPHGV